MLETGPLLRANGVRRPPPRRRDTDRAASLRDCAAGNPSRSARTPRTAFYPAAAAAADRPPDSKPSFSRSRRTRTTTLYTLLSPFRITPPGPPRTVSRITIHARRTCPDARERSDRRLSRRAAYAAHI